ncbi:MAG: hypothetical protein VKJ66_08725 [Synechococcus sp.]|nr:hypothetical protein [Synechococcus sp.]
MNLLPALTATALGLAALLAPLTAGAAQAPLGGWVAEVQQAQPAPPAQEELEGEPVVARRGLPDDSV